MVCTGHAAAQEQGVMERGWALGRHMGLSGRNGIRNAIWQRLVRSAVVPEVGGKFPAGVRWGEVGACPGLGDQSSGLPAASSMTLGWSREQG